MRIVFAALISLGLVFGYGAALGQEEDDALAEQQRTDGRAFYFNKVECDKGNAEACTNAGSLQLRSGGPERAEEAVALIVKGCELGDPAGCFTEGALIMLKGELATDLEVVRASKLIRCACEEDGHEPACEMTANWVGDQTCQSLTEFLATPVDTRSIEERAADGDADAQYQLGGWYFFGEEEQGISIDRAVGAQWFTKAAEQGNVGAQRILGLLYEEGAGVAKDLSKATDWARKAAIAGDPLSQYQVGQLLNNQDNPQYTTYEAVKWLKMVAERDGSEFPEQVGRAIFDVVLLGYDRAGYVRHSPEEVTALLRKASALGNEDARQELTYHCEDHPDACN